MDFFKSWLLASCVNTCLSPSKFLYGVTDAMSGGFRSRMTALQK